jgi:hypothetical protein
MHQVLEYEPEFEAREFCAIRQGRGQSKRGRYEWRADRYFNWINRSCVVQTPALHDKELYIQTHGRNEYQEGNLGEHIVS